MFISNKFPLPTYRADEFTGDTPVCGQCDVERMLFALWVSRARLCAYFDIKKYLRVHRYSKMTTSDMCMRLNSAYLKCITKARQFGDVPLKKFNTY